MLIETKRLVICKFTMDMAYDVHINSLDEDNKRFVPDEVFETLQDAQDTLSYLISCYESNESPLVYPILLKDNTNIGYVQAIQLNENEYEIGYHIAKKYTGNGYAKEAVAAFLPVIMKKLNLKEMTGVCLKDNIASSKVMEAVGFVKTFDDIGPYQGQQRHILKYIYR